MIIYDKKRKTLVVPEGIGCECSGGDCAEEYRQGYQRGYDDGIADCSGSTPCDCSSAITEAYQSGYTEGYNQGQADCPECDCSSAVTEAYESGVTEGIAEQKSLLVSSAFTRNGIYTRENGWNEIEVNVPQWLPAEEKTLSLVRNVSGPWEVLADSPIGMSKVTVEDNGYGSWKYDQGYQAGIAQCSGGTSCSLQDDYELYLDGSETAGQMPIWPNEGYDGISEGRVFYMEAYQNQWNSGHTSGFTDGYQSGYTEGYTQGQADCPQCSGGTGCNLEEKQVLLQSGDVGVWPVSPSSGYDGMYSVVVSDDGYGQYKYSEGYTTGSADGYAVGEQYGFENGYQSGYTDGYNSAITANCGSAITEAYESGYTAGEGEIHTIEVVIKTENNYYEPFTGEPEVVVVMYEGEGVFTTITPYDQSNIIEGDGLDTYVGTYKFITQYSSNPNLYYSSQIYNATAKTLTLCFKGYLYNGSGVYPQPPIYACPSSLGVNVMESNINNWGNWAVESVRFNGRPLYDNNGGLSKIGNGGFKLKPTYYEDTIDDNNRRDIFMVLYEETNLSNN